MGAGDAFNAGYLHALMVGADFERALDIGSWVASRVVSHAGDYEGLPTAAELAAFEAAPGGAAMSIDVTDIRSLLPTPAPIAVVRTETSGSALEMAKALVAGGIQAVEITLTIPGAVS